MTEVPLTKKSTSDRKTTTTTITKQSLRENFESVHHHHGWQKSVGKTGIKGWSCHTVCTAACWSSADFANFLTSDPCIMTDCMQVTSTLMAAVCKRSTLFQHENVIGVKWSPPPPLPEFQAKCFCTRAYDRYKCMTDNFELCWSWQLVVSETTVWWTIF